MAPRYRTPAAFLAATRGRPSCKSGPMEPQRTAYLIQNPSGSTSGPSQAFVRCAPVIFSQRVGRGEVAGVTRLNGIPLPFIGTTSTTWYRGNPPPTSTGLYTTKLLSTPSKRAHFVTP